MANLQEDFEELFDIGQIFQLYFPKLFAEQGPIDAFEEKLTAELSRIKDSQGELQAAHDMYIVFAESEKMIGDEMKKDLSIDARIASLNVGIEELLRGIDKRDFRDDIKDIREYLAKREGECKRLQGYFEATKPKLYEIFSEVYAKALLTHLQKPLIMSKEWYASITNRGKALDKTEAVLPIPKTTTQKIKDAITKVKDVALETTSTAINNVGSYFL